MNCPLGVLLHPKLFSLRRGRVAGLLRDVTGQLVRIFSYIACGVGWCSVRGGGRFAPGTMLVHGVGSLW